MARDSAVVETAGELRAETTRLLNDVATFLRRFLVLRNEEHDLLALWVVHTHTFEAVEVTPYLAILSPEKACGKTSILKCLKVLCAKPKMTGSISAAYLARIVERDRPTLLIDEADAGLAGNGEVADAIRGVLNTGFEIDGAYARCSGDNHEPREWSTFCPKAIAGIGNAIPDTVLSRSVVVRPRRKLPNEQVEKFRTKLVRPDGEALRERLESWADNATDVLSASMPHIPDELGVRDDDIWEPLLAIAELAGGTWIARAHAAARLVSDENREPDSLGTLLLHDIRRVFVEERMASERLVSELCSLEESPWGGFSNVWGSSLDARSLAKQLKPYGIGPRSIRFGKVTKSGYLRGAFAETWERYLHAEDHNVHNNPDTSDAPVEDVEAVELPDDTVWEPPF